MISFDRKSESQEGKGASRAFKKWVLSLSWEELTEASQVPLSADDEALLQEMVKALVPPETPIHARACPSSTFIFDGRSLAQQKMYRRKYRPRLLQLVRDSSSFAVSLPDVFLKRNRRNKRSLGHKDHGPSDFSVRGRNFIQRDGERLSIPPTQELLEADQTFIERVVLVPAEVGQTIPVEQNSQKVGPIQSFVCWTKIGEKPCDRSVEGIYNLWYRVSRGQLGTSGGGCTELSSADWLDPTDPLCRPFSLAMFIVSRFENSLYKRFKAENSPRLALPFSRPFSHTTWVGALSKTLKSDIGQLSPNCNPRRSMIWALFDDGTPVRIDRSLRELTNDISCGFSASCSLPLLLLDSASGSFWKNLRCAHHEDEARRIELELLGDLGDEETVKTSPTKNKSSRVVNKTKRRQKRRTSNRSKSAKKLMPASSEEDLSEMSKNSSESDDASNGFTVTRAMTRRECVLSREKNRNLVLVLSIVDEVLDDTFRKLGFTGETNGGKEADLVPVGTKFRADKTTRFVKGKSLIPLSSSSSKTRGIVDTTKPKVRVDEIDHGSKSIPQSNNASSSVDGTLLASTEVEERQFTLPVYGSGFVSDPVIERGEFSQADAEAKRMEENTTYDSITNSGWFKEGPVEVPIWEPHNYVTLDQWRSLQGHGARDRSIMEEFFRAQQEREWDMDENQMASSTLASIASSTEDVNERVEEVMDVLDEGPSDVESTEENAGGGHAIVDSSCGIPEVIIENDAEYCEQMDSRVAQASIVSDTNASASFDSESFSKATSPDSPVLISLEDLRSLGKEATVTEKNDYPADQAGPPSVKSLSSVPTGPGVSLPNFPQESKPRLTTSLSRENLRTSLSHDKELTPRAPKRSPSVVSDAGRTTQPEIGIIPKMKSRDDTEIRPRGSVRKSTDALSSYRNAAARSLKSRDDVLCNDLRTSSERKQLLHGEISANRKPSSALERDKARVFGSSMFYNARNNTNSDRYAVSEIADDDCPQLPESRRSVPVDEGDNITVTRDGSTTITSALSHRETEESLREERDTYRDVCLTLGAEVASLKSILASYRGSTSFPAIENGDHFPRINGAYQFFDPDSVANIVNRYSRKQTMAAMSDAGYRGEHESMASEEDIGKEKGSLSHRAQISANATVAGSDVSLEHSVRHERIPVAVPTLRNSYDQAPVGGFQSRLGRDVLHFVNSINSQLQKQDTRRAKAVERMTRLVTAVWPRAQVKVYGSHVTGLCLPSSDVDFVICLPAVHKNAPAVAPGALEGRNAINETSQKLLARKLKSESWIDPRSLQLIDRTVVPVIKVSTKDTRARSVHLDITFDSPSHHGVEAVDMVLDIMQELPMIRPLVLVLKSFLDDKNFLSAYKGGLSSYCLFLMTAKYLQEQSSSWGDCGSLLMGFLDFYGNHFNARTTGISVRNRLYFARPNYTLAQQATPVWPPHAVERHPMQTHPGTHDKSFARRNSFNDKGGIGDLRRVANTAGRFPNVGFQPLSADLDPSQTNYGMPTFEFDPLFVEDPLSPGNNVGRNAFRFPQVQRSFSDAHRALLAALEWDLESAEDLPNATEYPLLNSLLSSEDIVCDL